MKQRKKKVMALKITLFYCCICSQNRLVVAFLINPIELSPRCCKTVTVFFYFISSKFATRLRN